MHFLPVLELSSDSLTAIQVEPHQCTSHHSILQTKGPIHEIFTKKCLELVILENKPFFQSAILIFFFKKKIILLHSHVKMSKLLGQQGWVEILMITWFPSSFLLWANILHSGQTFCTQVYDVFLLFLDHQQAVCNITQA